MTHHITEDIIVNNDIIVCVTLKIINTKLKGKKLYKIATYYPSSQICSYRGYKNPLLKNLSIRNYCCPNCNYELDRDENAFVNIMFEGLKLYMNEVYT